LEGRLIRQVQVHATVVDVGGAVDLIPRLLQDLHGVARIRAYGEDGTGGEWATELQGNLAYAEEELTLHVLPTNLGFGCYQEFSTQGFVEVHQ
jgi:hypothetical protein